MSHTRPLRSRFEKAQVRERTALRVLITCLVLLCLWQVWAYRRVEIYHPDSSTYLVLAENLSDGDGYMFNGRPQTRYPPGLPLLLAGTSEVVGNGYHSLVRLMALSGLVGLVGCVFLIRREEGWPVAALACLWLASSPDYFTMATRYVWSDLPYFAISTGALLVAARLASARASEPFAHNALRPATAAWTVALCLLVAAAVLVRSAGVALAAAAIVTAAFGRRLAPYVRGALLAAGGFGAATQAAWMLWARPRTAPTYPGEYMHSYGTQLLLKNPHEPELGAAGLGDLATRIGYFAVAQLTRFTELLLPVPWLDVLWFSPMVILPAILIVVGLVVSLRQGRSLLLAWYALAYLGLYALWPFDEGSRFTVPIFPLLFLFFWRGLVILAGALEDHPATLKWAAAALGVATAVSVLGYLLTRYRGRQALAAVLFWFCAFASTTALAAWRGSRPLVRRQWVLWSAPLAALPIAAGLFVQARVARENVNGGPTAASAALAEASRWLREQAPGSVPMAQQSAILHRLTGRPVRPFPVTWDGRFLSEVMREQQVRYLVLTPERDEYFRPSQRARFAALRASEPACCELVNRSEGCEIYLVRVAGSLR